jgi:integrase
MGTVRRIVPAAGDVTLGQAAGAYLATLRGAEHASTRRTYGRILRRIVTEFGSDATPGIDPERFAAWFTAQWADRSPSTWNVSLDAIRSAAAWWQQQGWITADPSRMLKRRKPRPDRARALSRPEVEQLLTREDISLRERTLWRMLYETAARSAEVLALDVEDLDLPNRQARVRRKGGAIDVIIWQTGTARLLPRLLKGRKSGPVFVTKRKARVQLPAADLDPFGRARLSYQQAAALFSEASAGQRERDHVRGGHSRGVHPGTWRAARHARPWRPRSPAPPGRRCSQRAAWTGAGRGAAAGSRPGAMLDCASR